MSMTWCQSAQAERPRPRDYTLFHRWVECARWDVRCDGRFAMDRRRLREAHRHTAHRRCAHEPRSFWSLSQKPNRKCHLPECRMQKLPAYEQGLVDGVPPSSRGDAQRHSLREWPASAAASTARLATACLLAASKLAPTHDRTNPPIVGGNDSGSATGAPSAVPQLRRPLFEATQSLHRRAPAFFLSWLGANAARTCQRLQSTHR